MDLRWPMVGREGEIERVHGMLRDGTRTVVLAGAPGVGKTRLAGDCLELAANAGYVPLRIGATQGAASLPFGAYASLVPDLGARSGRDEVLRTVASAVLARGRERPVALFVDDAHLLDDSSAAVTHVLASGEEPLFMVATVRSGAPASDAVMSLWKDGLAERIEVPPLGAAEIADLLALALGGQVDSATTELLWERTEGNVLFLRELVIAAVDAGTLRQEDGVWRLRGALAISSRLVEIIGARLGELSDEVARALGIVALGEPLGVDVYGRIDTGSDLEDLERRGLVAIERQGQRLDVRLAHPLYGEVIHSRMSPLRARTCARWLAAALEASGARRREDTLRIATLRLHGSDSTNPALMLRAATIARQRFDLPLAERLARAAVHGGAGFEAGLLLGQLRWWQGDAADADRRLSALVSLAHTDAERAALATVRMDVLGFGLNRNGDALRVADEALPTISDADARDRVTAYRARGLGWSGRSAAAIAAAEPVMRRARGATLIAACMPAATHMSMSGRITDALDAGARGYAAHLAFTGPPLTFSPGFHLFVRCSALNCAGRLQDAEKLGRAELDKAIVARSLEGRACFSMVLAATHVAQGRVETAALRAADSAVECRKMGWPLLTRMPLIYFAHALALQGETGRARTVLDEIDALAVPTEHMFGAELLRARAWVAVAGGGPSDGHPDLLAAAAMANAAGAHAFEGWALHDLARLGRAAQVAPRLRELAAVVEGPLCAASTLHADALAADDAPALTAASIAFEHLGALLLAAEGAGDAAVAWRRALEPRKATAAEQRAIALAARCEGARTPALTAVAPARATLTARELEIARLAARGLSNKEIASRLFLSHRTVENKLHNCYAKLGADGRRDLARALQQY